MIDLARLFQLESGQRRRKLALTFGALERDVLGIAEKGTEYSFSSMARAEYIKQLAKILLKDEKLDELSRNELNSLIKNDNFDELRVCNVARNAILSIIGTFPAEWDLVIAPHVSPLDENGVTRKRDFFPGVCVYAEDIRSPFNVGSIFRTAEAMGADKVFISPRCVDPTQPRAIRSAMGCIETMGWNRIALEDLPPDLPIFALETGGIDIDKFIFPQKGVCIIGSEELGVSPEALKKATHGRVAIPMKGLKASLNVGVAFGILMQKWVESIEKRKNE